MKQHHITGALLAASIVALTMTAYHAGKRVGAKAGEREGYETGRDAAMAVGQVIIDRWKAEYKALLDTQNSIIASCDELYSTCIEALK